MKTFLRIVVLASLATALFGPAARAARPRLEAVGYIEKIVGDVYIDTGDKEIKLNPNRKADRTRKLYANEIVHCKNGGELHVYLYKWEEEPNDRRIVIKEKTAEIKKMNSQDPPETIELDGSEFRIPGRSGMEP